MLTVPPAFKALCFSAHKVGPGNPKQDGYYGASVPCSVRGQAGYIPDSPRMALTIWQPATVSFYLTNRIS